MTDVVSTDREVAAQIAAEQAHVDRVYDELGKAAARVELVHAEGMSRGQTDRRGTGDPREEELAGLFERDALVYSASKRRASLEHQHEGLVFGRLDLEHDVADEHGSTREVRYVGRLGVRDDDYEPLVVDWRAPAAAPFYRATPVDPQGVLRRRVLRCRGEQVVGVEDDLMVTDPPEDVVVVGDGALMAALTRSRGAQMRDIVATIQQHQDEAIRASARGVTEITGGPGTGKTVVALHRAAYLLYSDRRRFEGGGVLVVGPSAAYTAYIERVLPSLGEDSVVLRSLGDVLAGITATRLDPPAVAATKGSLRIRRVLSRLVREPIPGSPTQLRTFVGGHAIRLDLAALDRARAQVLRHHHRNAGYDAAVEALAHLAWEQVEQGEREDFVDRFTDSGDVEAFMRQWWAPVDPREMLLWLADEELVRRLGGLPPEAAADLAASYRQALELGTWTVADVALVDDLAARLGPPVDLPSEDRGFFEIEELDDASQYGVSALRVGADGETVAAASGGSARSRVSTDPRERLLAGRTGEAEEYAHVLVDEAQDLSPMQWRMLGRRGRWASWTVVGDLAQASWDDLREAGQAREEAFGTAPRQAFHMDTNYRNAREIFELAARVITEHVPEADIPEAVRETGHDPLELSVSSATLPESVAETVADLCGEVAGQVAVIAPWSWHERLRPVVTGDQVVLIDPLSTKGLEYDATVVVDPDGIVAESPGGVRALYVVLTRAAHRSAILRPVDESAPGVGGGR
ncbi:putative helicase protein [Serinicoccus hydrothermalis]|uniref:Putative helicase protein n=1 Tax=Serinicoccus hydrothermalis TaxID=1758689 RepID=A0A1B1NBU7_9MICO|nr:AAA family ATPase [Serinicoccus hydrothermalis]ANS78919.1 putative helicase protein [Serinicoccus hydrothermalis]